MKLSQAVNNIPIENRKNDYWVSQESLLSTKVMSVPIHAGLIGARY